jgi:hypothetical protein
MEAAAAIAELLPQDMQSKVQQADWQGGPIAVRPNVACPAAARNESPHERCIHAWATRSGEHQSQAIRQLLLPWEYHAVALSGCPRPRQWCERRGLAVASVREVIGDVVAWKTTGQDVARNHRLLQCLLRFRKWVSHGHYLADVYLRLNARFNHRLFGPNLTPSEQRREAWRESGKAKKLMSHLLTLARRSKGARDRLPAGARRQDQLHAL